MGSILRALWSLVAAAAGLVGLVSGIATLAGQSQALDFLVWSVLVLVLLVILLALLGPRTAAVSVSTKVELDLDANGNGRLRSQIQLVPLVRDLRIQEWTVGGSGTQAQTAELEGSPVRVSEPDVDGLCVVNFGRTLRRFRRQSIVRSITYLGSYCGAEEFYRFRVLNRTIKLELIVKFPAERIPTGVRRTFLPDNFGRDKGPAAVVESVATWTIWFPQFRAAYRLDWSWDAQEGDSQEGQPKEGHS